MLYGPGYSKPLFDNHLRNIWIIQIDAGSHHCPVSECSAVKASCFRKLHLAFCCKVIKMDNGCESFCGMRFGVETPKGCSRHHYSRYDDNLMFKNALKGLEYELPNYIPHLEPGWFMLLPKFDRNCAPATIRVGKYKGGLSLIRDAPTPGAGQAAGFIEVLEMPGKELAMLSVQINEDSESAKYIASNSRREESS